MNKMQLSFADHLKQVIHVHFLYVFLIVLLFYISHCTFHFLEFSFWKVRFWSSICSSCIFFPSIITTYFPGQNISLYFIFISCLSYSMSASIDLCSFLSLVSLSTIGFNALFSSEIFLFPFSMQLIFSLAHFIADLKLLFSCFRDSSHVLNSTLFPISSFCSPLSIPLPYL